MSLRVDPGHMGHAMIEACNREAGVFRTDGGPVEAHGWSAAKTIMRDSAAGQGA